MADFKRVNPGDKLKIPAETYNAFIDMATAMDTGADSGPNRAALRNSAIIRVQNVSGAAVDELNILTLKEPVTVPPDNNADSTDSATNEFKSRLIFEAVKPAEGDEGRWCVLLKPLADQQFGPAVVIGVTQCLINLKNTGDRSVECAAGVTIPESAESGSAQIIWVKGGVGTAASTGIQWADIKIGGGSAALPVGQYMGMGYMMTSQNQSGWSFPFFGAYIG